MSNKRLVQIRDKFYCDYLENVPNHMFDTSKQIYITDEDRLAIGLTKCFDLENNCVVDYDNTEDLKKAKLEELRAKRQPLLIAFDKYKSNVVYGVEFETEEQRLLIIEWYNAILNLSEYAIENIPDRIKYYL